ncbi:trypsin-like peptidase domain-containing protein [Actinomadura sp. NPDC000929]|uniref:S1 family peptidase n=1 Tax=Actinomadura sp. NPDC000929 TaxID=3154517 RepID=UPI0033984B05
MTSESEEYWLSASTTDTEPNPDWAAEIIVDKKDSGGEERASGYLIANGLVITCAHAIRDAAQIRVRFRAESPEEWTGPGEVISFSNEESLDVAVIRIEKTEATKRSERLKFGRISRDRDTVIQCTGMGYPAFKIRATSSSSDPSQKIAFRDSFYLSGSISLLSNQKSRTLEVNIANPPAPTQGQISPWSGISGTALFANGMLIGLVSRHHWREGPGRLDAVQISTWYESLGSEELEKLTSIGCLPSAASEIEEAIPDSRVLRSRNTYLAQVRNLAAPQLIDRRSELRRLTEFVASNENYIWLQAPPWAGKTALMAEFTLNPPRGTRVAAFFVTSRLVSEADSSAFLRTMILQLALIAGEPAPGPTGQVNQYEIFLRLVEVAAAHISKAERLVLVIDGLDEDNLAGTSIASMLPRAFLGNNTRVIVTGRPHPDLPHDVPAQHPLRTCTRRPLSASPHAKNLEIEAENELHAQMRDSPENYKILGLLVACGDGLTSKDFAELLGASSYILKRRLNGSLGRTLKKGLPDRGEPTYFFAHQTLQAKAQELLGADLARFKENLYTWARGYQDAGWPEDTPGYLLQPYWRLLITAKDTEQLRRVTTDPRRLDLMRNRRSAPVSVLNNIDATRSLLLQSPDFNVTDLVRLALERYRLIHSLKTGSDVAASLWADLQPRSFKKFQRARMSLFDQVEALEYVASKISKHSPTLAHRLAVQASRTTRLIQQANLRKLAARKVVRILGEIRQWQEIQTFISSIKGTTDDDNLWGDFAIALAEAGEGEIALDTLSSIKSKRYHIYVSARVAGLLCEMHRDLALQLLSALREKLAPPVSDRTLMLAAATAASTYAKLGQWSHAEELSFIIDARFSDRVKAEIAVSMVTSGASTEGQRIFQMIDERQIADEAVGRIIDMLPLPDHLPIALQQCETIASHEVRTKAFTGMFIKLKDEGRGDEYDYLLRKATEELSLIEISQIQSQVARWMIRKLLNGGRFQSSEQLAYSLSSSQDATMLIGEIAAAWSHSNPERARELLTSVFSRIDSIESTSLRMSMLHNVTNSLMDQRAWHLADKAIDRISPDGERARRQGDLVARMLSLAATRDEDDSAEYRIEQALKHLKKLLLLDHWIHGMESLALVSGEAFDVTAQALFGEDPVEGET